MTPFPFPHVYEVHEYETEVCNENPSNLWNFFTLQSLKIVGNGGGHCLHLSLDKSYFMFTLLQMKPWGW